jgi:glycosyltransferase involved in cell wall biosynthesis
MSARSRKGVIFCGTRGVPARYGGFETAVDEISRRFVAKGYDCAVVCRRSSGGEALHSHEGRKLVYVEGSRSRTLDTFASAIRTGLYLLRHRKAYDHAFWFNNANLPGILLTLAAGTPTSVNTDGLEWRRAKWRLPFKAYYYVASFLIARLCRCVISDSRAIQSYYERAFRRQTQFVPYGVPQSPAVSPQRRREILEAFGLEPQRYFLQITRFEPDNLPLEDAVAFRAAGLSRRRFKLLLVGYQHSSPYAQQIKEMSGTDGIMVVDALYDQEVLAALRQGCFCYVHGNSVGGTNPALLEAMASCPRVLAVDLPFSREVLGSTGYFFRLETMTSAFRDVLESPDRSAEMRQMVRSRYRWDEVAESYMRLAEGEPAAYSPSGA